MECWGAVGLFWWKSVWRLYVDHELFTSSTSSEPLHTLSTDFPHFHKCSSRGPEKVLYLFGAFRNTVWPLWSRHFPELLYINMKSPDLPEIFLLRVLKKCLTFGRDSKYKIAALTSDLQRHLVLWRFCSRGSEEMLFFGVIQNPKWHLSLVNNFSKKSPEMCL